jgi:ribosomal protein S18 acetylase RimI-like enzyme
MLIRNATVDDLEALLALNTFVQQRHADELPRLFNSPMKSQQTAETFRHFIADSTSLVLLAVEKEPVGYLWAQFQNRPANWALRELQLLYIQHMVVAPKFRRQSVGTLLMSAALNSAKSKGIERVELDVWSFNLEAKHFYAKHGFKVFNEKMVHATDAT